MILAIDPSPTGGHAVGIDSDGRVMKLYPDLQLDDLRLVIRGAKVLEIACEDFQPYGTNVGMPSIETVKNIGSIREMARANGVPLSLHRRPQIKRELCGNPNRKDTHVRRRVLDLYPQTGGGKEPAIGTKKQPGPLYGIKGDLIAALAVGLVHLQLRGSGPLWEWNRARIEEEE